MPVTLLLISSAECVAINVSNAVTWNLALGPTFGFLAGSRKVQKDVQMAMKVR